MASLRRSLRLSRLNYCEQPTHTLQQYTLCHYTNGDRKLIHQYILITAPEHDEYDELYKVIEVDPRADDLRVYTRAERGNPQGILPREQLTEIVVFNNDNHAWSVLRVHFLQRLLLQNARLEQKRGHVQAFTAESKQVLYNLGHTVHTSMNNRMFRRECELIRNERMSLNVFESVGRDALKRMADSYSKKGSYHYFDDISFETLAKTVGVESLTRTIKKNSFFITNINMYYSEDNMKLTIKYWLVREDANGKLSTLAHAAKKRKL